MHIAYIGLFVYEKQKLSIKITCVFFAITQSQKPGSNDAPFANHVHPFMYQSTNGYFQHDNAAYHKAKVVSNWFHKHDNKFNVLQWPL